MDARPTSEEYLQKLLGFQTREELIQFLNEPDHPRPEPCLGGCGKLIVIDGPEKELCPECDARRKMEARRNEWLRTSWLIRIELVFFQLASIVFGIVCFVTVSWIVGPALYQVERHPWSVPIAAVAAGVCYLSYRVARNIKADILYAKQEKEGINFSSS